MHQSQALKSGFQCSKSGASVGIGGVSGARTVTIFTGSGVPSVIYTFTGGDQIWISCVNWEQSIVHIHTFESGVGYRIVSVGFDGTPLGTFEPSNDGPAAQSSGWSPVAGSSPARIGRLIISGTAEISLEYVNLDGSNRTETLVKTGVHAYGVDDTAGGYDRRTEYIYFALYYDSSNVAWLARVKMNGTGYEELVTIGTHGVDVSGPFVLVVGNWQKDEVLIYEDIDNQYTSNLDGTGLAVTTINRTNIVPSDKTIGYTRRFLTNMNLGETVSGEWYKIGMLSNYLQATPPAKHTPYVVL